MSNIPASIPPKGEKEKVKELPSTSQFAKAGFKRVETPSKQGTTAARAAEPKGKAKASDKPIESRSVASSKVPKEQTSDVGPSSEQLLPDELLNVIAKFSSVPDFAAMSQVSKTLKKLSQETDLERLKEFSQNKQLGLKEEMALSILLIAGQAPLDLSVGDITSRARVDTKIEMGQTPEELLSQLATIEANYEQIQSAYNDILQRASNFAGDMVFLSGRLMPIGFVLAYFALRVATFSDEMSRVRAIGELVLGGIISYFVAEDNIFPSVAIFRAAVPEILDTLTKKVGLSNTE